MHSQAVYLSLGALFTGAALASPAQSTTSLSKRCDRPVNTIVNDFGNIVVHYSDTTVKLGNLDPTVALQVIGTQCATAGTCSPHSWKVTAKAPTTVPGGKALTNLELEFKAEGLYPVWIHNGLYAALMTAIAQSVKKELVTYTPPAANCGRVLCTRQSDQVWQYTIPDWIAVYFYHPTDCDADPAYMGISTTPGEGAGTGFCSFFAGLGGAVASGMNANPVIGSVFSLMGLVCAANGA